MMLDHHEETNSDELRMLRVTDWILVGLALAFALIGPLREWLGHPSLWVLADFSAAMVIAFFEIRGLGLDGRLFGNFLLLGTGSMALLLAIEVDLIIGGLFIFFVVNAWRISQRGPVEAFNEIARAGYAVMGAGMPAIILYAWSAPGWWVEGVLAGGYFALSAVMRRHKPADWLQMP